MFALYGEARLGSGEEGSRKPSRDCKELAPKKGERHQRLKASRRMMCGLLCTAAFGLLSLSHCHCGVPCAAARSPGGLLCFFGFESLPITILLPHPHIQLLFSAALKKKKKFIWCAILPDWHYRSTMVRACARLTLLDSQTLLLIAA